jgi:hypothetical protein
MTKKTDYFEVLENGKKIGRQEALADVEKIITKRYKFLKNDKGGWSEKDKEVARTELVIISNLIKELK